jgi:hypothetical protein
MSEYNETLEYTVWQNSAFFRVATDGPNLPLDSLRVKPCVSHYLALLAAKHIFLLVTKT